MRFYLLEIQKNVEEKRLIIGKKLEDYLAKKSAALVGFFSRFISSKEFLYISCTLVIAVAVFLGSVRDLGHDSALYIEIAQKMLRGGKYYYDFYENNLPLSFLFTIIPVSVANFFHISPIVVLEIFIYLVGIFTIYFSARILQRSSLSQDRTAFNLLVIAVAVGFFWRVFTSAFNEIGTKSTYLLACAFPYVFYHLIKNSDLKKSDHIIIGFLAAILCCLKPNYAILPILFELRKVYKNKSLKSAFCLRNYTTLVVLASYFLLLLCCFPEFLQFSSQFRYGYFSATSCNLAIIFTEDLMPLLLLSSLCFFLIKKDDFIPTFLLATISIGLVVLSEFIGGYDQRFAVYSLSLPLVFVLLLKLQRSQLIDWKNNWLLLLLILIIPQFEQDFFTKVILNLCAFWWVATLILSRKWQKISVKNLGKFWSLLSNFFLPRNLFSAFCFSVLTATSIYLVTNHKLNGIAIVSSAIILILLVNFYQKLYCQFIDQKKLSLASLAMIFLVISYMINIYSSSIIGKNENYTSPNFANDKVSEIIRNNAAAADDEIVSIAWIIPETYPVMTYAKKINPLPNSQFPALFLKIGNRDVTTESQSYLLSRLREQMANPQNKLIFVNGYYLNDYNKCNITFLEYYFRDQEFRKIFLKNYVFLNRVITTKNQDRTFVFFKDQEPKNDPTAGIDLIERDIEVYVRK